MAVYFVTGKLGSGKTLVSIGKIRDKLWAGCKVATNVDINLHKLVNPDSKGATLYRIPDKPTLEDLHAIGKGNDSYDEAKNGLLVLDECGTWFNSRSWGDKSRQDVINWFLHARKLGWDIIFLVQDISIVDKQAREALAEHVVYCRRLDRVGIPFLSALLRLARINLKLPRLHLAIVKYGHQQSSMVLERWLYAGRDLYQAYDTKQAFSDHYEHKTYQVLPPYYSHYRYRTPRTPEYYMKLTRIYWKRFSRPVVFTAGLLLGVLFTAGYLLHDLVQQKKEQQQQALQQTAPADSPASSLQDARIIGYSRLGDWENHRLLTRDFKPLTTDALKALGYQIQPVNACQVIITRGSEREDLRC